jgi:hypothetical protein
MRRMRQAAAASTASPCADSVRACVSAPTKHSHCCPLKKTTGKRAKRAPMVLREHSHVRSALLLVFLGRKMKKVENSNKKKGGKKSKKKQKKKDSLFMWKGIPPLHRFRNRVTRRVLKSIIFFTVSFLENGITFRVHVLQ